MNAASKHISHYLSSATRQAVTMRARANADQQAPNVELLRRVQRLCFGPNVKTLQQAANRLEGLIDELDGDDTKKKSVTPIE